MVQNAERGRIMARKTSNIDKILKHYWKIAGTSNSPTASAYALGIADATKHLKTIRDKLHEEWSKLWSERKDLTPAAQGRLVALKQVLELLDDIKDPQEKV